MKILIIGVGSIGTRHLKNLIKLGYKNLAVCDPEEKRLAAASLFGKFNLYKNAKTALKKERPDIVFVCNPTHLHVPTANLALGYGTHVFIEKPLSNNLNGVDALIKKAKRCRKTVMVACNFRFYKGFQKLQSVLEKNIYGKAILCRVAQGYYLPAARKNTNYKKIYASKKVEGGGVILDSGSHLANYLVSLFGGVQKKEKMLSGGRVLGIESEEAGAMIMEHNGGVLSIVSLDYVSRKPAHRIEVVTEKGLLTLDIVKDRLVFEDAKSEKELYRGDKNLNNMFVSELKHFLNSVKTGARPLQTLAEAKNILKTLI